MKLFDKLSIIDEKNAQNYKRKSSKTQLNEDVIKKSMIPFMSNNQKTNMLDRSMHLLPKSATIYNKYNGF